MKKIISLFAVIGIVALSLISAFAHSGRTDSNGGHYDRSTGEYHYHHGYSAHQHPNGVCPYRDDSYDEIDWERAYSLAREKDKERESTTRQKPTTTKTETKENAIPDWLVNIFPAVVICVAVFSVGGIVYFLITKSIK